MQTRWLSRFAALGLSTALAVTVFGTFVSLPAKAAEVEWKMHAVWVPTRPEIGFLKKWVDLVNERAAGKLKITLYPGGSLGIKDVDMLRILPAAKAIQAALLYPGYMSRDVPEYVYTLPPGVVKEPEKLVAILPTLSKIYGGTYKKWGIELLGYIQHPVRGTSIFCKTAVNTLDELKKKKVRVWEKSHVVAFGKIGVAAQVIPQNDLYVAMQTGVVDCAVYPIGFAVTVSLQEVAPYSAYLFPYVLHPLTLIVAKKAYDALPPDVQEILRKTTKEVEDQTNENYVKGTVDEKARVKIMKSGHTILPPFSPEDRAAFSAAVRETWQELSEKAGEKAIENYKMVLKALGG